MKDFGVLVPIVTPCNRNGRIDIPGVKYVCREMIETGNDGIFVMGSTGRGAYFSTSDRVKACQATAEEIKGEVPLFAGCMGNGVKEMINHASALREAGADFAVVTAPGYFPYLNEEIAAILLNFADKSPMPVLIYDVPVYTKTKLDEKTIEKFFRHENIIGMKDSTADFERFSHLLKILKPFSEKFLFQGKEQFLAKSLLSGGSGIVSSFSIFSPRLFVELVAAVREKNDSRVEFLQSGIQRLYDVVVQCLEKRPAISTLFHMLNYSLRQRGICENILLDHEGETPDWLLDKAKQAVEICNETLELGSNTW